MTRVGDVINYGFGLCVAVRLGIGFYEDSYLITIGLDEIIELYFSERYFWGS